MRWKCVRNSLLHIKFHPLTFQHSPKCPRMLFVDTTYLWVSYEIGVTMGRVLYVCWELVATRFLRKSLMHFILIAMATPSTFLPVILLKTWRWWSKPWRGSQDHQTSEIFTTPRANFHNQKAGHGDCHVPGLRVMCPTHRTVIANLYHQLSPTIKKYGSTS